MVLGGEVDGGRGGGLGFAELGGRRAGAMGDKNKEDAERDQMQKENKGKKVAGTKGVKRAQKIRSGAEWGTFPCCSFCEDILRQTSVKNIRGTNLEVIKLYNSKDNAIPIECFISGGTFPLKHFPGSVSSSQKQRMLGHRGSRHQPCCSPCTHSSGGQEGARGGLLRAGTLSVAQGQGFGCKHPSDAPCTPRGGEKSVTQR